MNFNVKVIARSPDYVPTRKTNTDAGFDLRACITEDNEKSIVEDIHYSIGKIFSDGNWDADKGLKPCKIIFNGADTHIKIRGVIDPISRWQEAQEVWENLVSLHKSLESRRAVSIRAGETKLVSAGIRIKMPVAPPGFNNVFMVYPRSGLGIKSNLILANSVGVVDQSYISNEVGLGLINNSNYLHIISDKARVAQGIFQQVLDASFEEVNEWDESEDRGGGFGSSGVHG
jgi:dUTP pyrophosphatase